MELGGGGAGLAIVFTLKVQGLFLVLLPSMSPDKPNMRGALKFRKQ